MEKKVKKNKITCIFETKGFLSDQGEKGWWYPDEKRPVLIKEGSQIEHLQLWRHQGDYLAFRAKAKDLNKNFCESDKHICVWIRKETYDWLFRNQNEVQL